MELENTFWKPYIVKLSINSPCDCGQPLEETKDIPGKIQFIILVFIH